MKQISKVIEVPSGATIAQIESALNVHLSSGWKLTTTLVVGGKVYVVLIKTIAN